VSTLIVLVPAAWSDKLPALVDQVAAAAEVRVKAPDVVVRLEAALPVRETAPVDWVRLPVMPRLPVTFVASWSSIVAAEFRTILPDVVVVRFRLPPVVLSAAFMLVLARLDSAVLAQPAHEPPPTLPTTRQKEVAAVPVLS
jgi:hypothetical protein